MPYINNKNKEEVKYIVEKIRNYDRFGRQQKEIGEWIFKSEKKARKKFKNIKAGEGKTYWDKKKYGEMKKNVEGNWEITEWFAIKGHPTKERY